VNSRALKISGFLAAAAALVAILVLTAATYAWFTFSTDTYVTPMSGTVSQGGGDLLISNLPDSGFGLTAELLTGSVEKLLPCSTADLAQFYTGTVQTPDGLTVRFAADADAQDTVMLHGTLYLRADGNDFDVYLWPESLSFGTDTQALAALRLGLRTTVGGETKTVILRLDSAGDTAGAAAQQTVSRPNSVVASAAEDGTPVFADDPARALTPFLAGGTSDDVQPGQEILCTIANNQVATVEYWYYLEGCDENCINAVQSRDAILQLGFAGVQAGA
jgi:hypothetical protein